MIGAGCRSRQHVDSGRPPTPSAVSFSDTAHGIAFSYPGGWTRRPSNDYVLLLVPPGEPNPPDRSISLDVPDLPVHIPGLIPAGLVKNGYIDDLKKQLTGFQIVEDVDYPVPHATARLVRSTGYLNGRPHTESALLIVHGDRVYIIRADATTLSDEQTVAAFDAAIKSLQWTK